MDIIENDSAQSQAIRASYLTAEDLNIAASLLYQAYHDDILLQNILQADASSPLVYEKKLRALIREELNSFWQAQQPLIGLFKGEALKAVACVIKSDTQLQPQRFWHWRLKLMLSAGYLTTQQLIDKESMIREALNQYSCYHFLAFIAVAPNMQKQGFGSYLLRALDDLINNDENTAGLAVYVTREDLQPVFKMDGFKLVQNLAFNNITGDLLFKAKVI